MILIRASLPAVVTLASIWGCSSETGDTGPDNNGTQATPASVVLTPSSGTIEEGDTLRFSAVVRDTDGNVMAGMTLGWRVLDGAVASVNSAGLVTGVGPGSTSLVVSMETLSDTAAITVTGMGPQPTPGECQNPAAEWIWCDDFEADRIASYFEYDDKGGQFTRDNGVGLSGSWGMTARFGQGDVSVGSLKLAFGATPYSYFAPVDGGTANYREIYWRLYLKNEPGWTGGGGDKLSRAIVFHDASWAQAIAAHVWSDVSPNEDVLMLDPASGTDTQGNVQTTRYNDFANFRWLGADRGSDPIFASSGVGQWHCIEARVRLNDPGATNGVFELWVDGSLDARRDNLNWVGSYSTYGINAIFFENYWNSGSPATQERYFDNIVVSTAPIGC